MVNFSIDEWHLLLQVSLFRFIPLGVLTNGGDLHFMNPTTLGWNGGGKGIIKNDACKNLQTSLYIVFGVCLILHINVAAISIIICPLCGLCFEVDWLQDWIALIIITTAENEGIDITLAWLPICAKRNV